MVTQFEYLPNEIFLDLCCYFNLRELYFSFSRLNFRYNALLDSIRNLSVNVYKNEPELVSLFARRISRLVIAYQGEIIDLSHYPYLRSLTLHGASESQLEQIRAELLPNLVYLFISSRNHPSVLIRIVRDAFSNKFPSLRCVDFGYIPSSLAHSQSVSMSLRSICICLAEPSLIPFILRSCPHLCYLQVYITMIFNEILIPSASSDHPLKTFILLESSGQIYFDAVENLLTYMPNVQRLYLQYRAREHLDQLARALFNRTRHLRRFGCNIQEVIRNDNAIDHDFIRRLHPCFDRIQIRTEKFVYRVYSTNDFA